jgi:hypothetical protein
MLDFIMTLLAGFALGALLMRYIYRRVDQFINTGQVKEMTQNYLRLMVLEKQILDLINESDGVSGLHKNGEIATWEWLQENGWFY